MSGATQEVQVGIKYVSKGSSHNPSGDGRSFDYYEIWLQIDEEELRIGEWGIPEGTAPQAFFDGTIPFWQAVVDNIAKAVRKGKIVTGVNTLFSP